MKTKYLAAIIGSLTVIALLFFLLTFEAKNQEQMVEKDAIKEVILSVFDGWNYNEEKSADFEALNAAFADSAILRSFRSGKMDVYYKEAYLEGYKRFEESKALKMVFEREITGEIEVFGRAAQYVGSYEIYYNDLSSPAEKGMNFIQLAKIEGKWRITSVMWDVETPDRPIPVRFMRKMGQP